MDSMIGSLDVRSRDAVSGLGRVLRVVAWFGRLVAPTLLIAGAGLGVVSPQTVHAEGEVPEGVDQSSQAAPMSGPASERYKAGFLRQAILGSGYRDLWEADVDVPILDLQKEGGGLTPTRRFGGLQTSVLGFVGADGRNYSFRGTDKNPSKVLDPLLQGTVVEWVVQEQMAAQNPGGPVVAGALTEKAGVITVPERMVRMPDDPILGEFREEFAGLLGTFFEYPQPASEDIEGFQGATEIIGYKDLYARLEASNADQVDTRAFLRARLMDIMLGDFDRHRKQWRWAKIPGNPRWQPIPEDRDIAFVRYNGFGPRLMSVYIPILQLYGPDYPRSIKGLTLHGWEQDRWLLPALAWDDWQSVIEEIQSDITDEAIDEAIAALPESYEEIGGDQLREAIRGRRDKLGKGARRFYEFLAKEVDVQTSDASDDIHVERLSNGHLRVEVRDQGSDGQILFRRDFDPDRTNEVRLYLRGGDDKVDIGGKPCPVGRRVVFSCIKLRVIAGTGSKQIDDRQVGGTRVYDSLSSAEVLEGPGTKVDRRPYTAPEANAGFVDIDDVPPRDWGSDTIPIPKIGVEPDIGVLIGLSASHTRFGFRKHPWASKHSIGVSFASEPLEFGARYRGEWRIENSNVVAGFDMWYSGYEVLNFFGFGNNTKNNISIRQLRISNEQFKVGPSLSNSFLDDTLRVTGGLAFQMSRTDPEDGDQPEPADPNPPFIAEFVDPLTGDDYGIRDFLLVAPTVRIQYDTRRSVHYEQTNLELPFNDNPAAGYPTSGVFLELEGKLAPPMLDVNNTYGTIGGSVSGYVSVGENARATLGARVGGKKTFGPTPFFDQAELGGGRFLNGLTNNRGFLARRFLGDSSAFANTDLRIMLARVKLIVPGDVGVLGFFDVGRVFLDGSSDDSREWHTSAGGGVWFAPLVRTNAISFTVAQSTEETLFYLRFGFHY